MLSIIHSGDEDDQHDHEHEIIAKSKSPVKLNDTLTPSHSRMMSETLPGSTETGRETWPGAVVYINLHLPRGRGSVQAAEQVEHVFYRKPNQINTDNDTVSTPLTFPDHRGGRLNDEVL